jgi:putative phage-type endonuclease
MYGANDQRTDAWHTKRGEMITASEVYQVLGSESARREVMMRKLEPRPQGDGSNPIPALIWGTRFEPVAKKIYEERTKCEITDVSCVQHPRHTFLGASPDGLIVPTTDDPRRYGRLVEFKCPMSRKPSDEIPPGYVHQMQMQMECTGIDECEYVEFRFKVVNYTEWKRSKDTKGCFAVYASGKVDYECDCDCEPEDAQVLHWILQSIKEDFVTKDPTWLPTVLPQLRVFWDEVVGHRTNGTRPDEPKKLPTLDL